MAKIQPTRSAMILGGTMAQCLTIAAALKTHNLRYGHIKPKPFQPKTILRKKTAA